MKCSDSQAPLPDATDRPGRRLHGLLLLNAALLAVLAMVTFGGRAFAQARLRGEYTMAAGGVAGADASAVYVVDTMNQEMIAIVFDPNTKQIGGIGYRNLAQDAATVVRPRSGG